MHRPNVRKISREEVVATVTQSEEKRLMNSDPLEETPECVFGWILVGVLLTGAIVLAAMPPF